MRYVFSYVFYVYRYFLTCFQFSRENKGAFTTCRTYYFQVAVYDRVGYILFFAEIVDLFSRREIVFLSQFHFGFVGNYRSIGFYGRRRKFFYRFAFFINLNIRNLEVRAFVAVHNELHSNTSAIFRHFYNNSYLGAIPTAVPLRVADYRRRLAVRIACSVCRICQEGDLVTACMRQVFTNVFYVNRYLLTCRQIFAKYKDVRATCRTYYLQGIIHDSVGYVLFFTEIAELVFRRKIIFLSRFHFGFVGNNGGVGVYGRIRIFGSGKFFHFFAFFVNLNVGNLEVRAFFAVHNELHSKPCTIRNDFADRSYLRAIPSAVPFRVADYRIRVTVRVTVYVCAIGQERDLVIACIRQVFTYVFYVYRYLLTCLQFVYKGKRAFAACRTYYLQVAVYNRVGYVLFFAEIIDLIFSREIIFRSRFYYGRGRRRIACVLNSNTRNLPIRVCVANVTELNSQTSTIFRDFRCGSEFTVVPKRGRFPLGYLLTVELCVARGHCAPGPKPPSVYDIPHYFTVDFHKLTCLQRHLQHKDGVKVRRRRIRFKVDRGKF